MKNFILLLFSLATVIASQAQERLTDKVGDGTSVRNILRAVDGDNYIVSIDNFDSIHIYLLVDDIPQLQHSTQYYGITGETFLSWSEHFFLTETAYGSVAYNFVTNEETIFDYPEGYSHSSWRHSYKDQVILRRTSQDFDLEEIFLVDLVTSTTIPIDNRYSALDQTENYVLLREYIDAEHSLSILLDKNTFEQDTISDQNFYYQSYALDDDKLVFIENDRVLKYNIDTKIIDSIYDLPDNYRRAKILKGDSQLIVSVTKQDWTKIILLIDDEGITDEYFLSSDFDDVFQRVVDNKIIGDDNGIVIYDIETNTEKTYNIYPPKLEEVVIIEDRFLIARENNRMSVIDMENEISYTLFDQDVGGYYEANYFQLDNGKYLIDFDGGEGRQKSLIEFNTETVSAQFSDIIDRPSNGLFYDSKLIEVNGQLFLISDDIYHVSGENAVKLNENETRDAFYRKYKIIDNQLYWIEVASGRFTVNTFDNEIGDVEVANIPGHVGASPWNWLLIDNYTVADQYVYFIDDAFTTGGPSFSEFLWRFDTVTGEKIQIEELSFSSKLLSSRKGYVYFSQGGFLHAIDLDGTISNLSVPSNDFIFSEFYDYNDQLLFTGVDGFYKLDGVQATKLLDIPSPGFVSIQFINEGILLYDNDFSYLYDGESVQEYEFDGSNPVQLSEDYYMTSVSTGTNTFINTIHQISTDTEYSLPDSIAGLRIAGLFPHSDRLILVSTSGLMPFQEVLVYSVDQDFTNFDLVNRFESGGRGVRSSLETYQQEAFLYAGSRFFLMNENLEFFSIDNLGGDPSNTVVIERDGYFYFVAFGPDYGRQLYRVQVYSERSASDVLLNPQKEWSHVNLTNDLVESNRIRLSEDVHWIDGAYYYNVEISSTEQGEDFIFSDAYLREDSGTVWKNINGQASLIYNFNLEVGDTLNVELESTQSHHMIVSDIDEVQLENGDIRKRWIFNNASDDECHLDSEFYYIEGVGANRGLIYHHSSSLFDSGCTYLTCMNDNALIVYKSGNFNSCFVTSTSDLTAFDFSIFPNPASTSIFVDSEEQIDLVRITDILGQPIASSRAPEVNVSDIIPGIYIMTVVSENGQSASSRIVIER